MLPTLLLDALYPPRCAACDGLLPAEDVASGAFEICAPCESLMVRVGGGCRTCGLPGKETDACERCEDDPPAFDGASAIWLYGGSVAALLHRYKYEQRPHYARALGERLAKLDLPPADVVTHVPLHRLRRLVRTYDQALYLARALARARKIPFETLLVRTRATGRQVGRSREARRLNMNEAFGIRGSVARRRIWLVDDVVTTGATADACAQALVDAGAFAVHLVSVARAVV